MRTSILKIFLVISLTIVLLLPSTVYGAASVKYDVVSAFFVDVGPCIRTAAHIDVHDRSARNWPDTPGVSQTVDFLITQWDYCANAGSFHVWADEIPIGKGDFKLLGNLQSATLDTKFQATNSVTNLPVTIEIHLTWTGSSEVSTGGGRYKLHNTEVLINDHSATKRRIGVASGAMSVDSFTFTATSVDAFLESGSDHRVEIHH
jgi:hypothetical protein